MNQPYKNLLFYFIATFVALVPTVIFAGYGYLTMPVDPSTLSYVNGNQGINAWFDHKYPLELGDTGAGSSTFVRYDGLQSSTSSWINVHTCGNATSGNGAYCYNGHAGIDFAVATGTTVYAAASGTVEQAQWQDPFFTTSTSNFGIFVRIWHPQYGFSTLYAHLDATDTWAIAGDNATRTEPIGLSGNTGCVKPCSHLHFQVYGGNPTITSSTQGGNLGSDFSDSVDPFGWSGTSTDPWAATDTLGYMWASPGPFATSSVFNFQPVNFVMTTSTTWKANQIYIIQTSLTVSSSATLTIPAGTVVKFDSTSTYMEVKGTLKVTGTASSPVYFTSIEDDTVGGDTNDDATATTPGQGNWGDLRFDAGSSSTINYATIRYGGYDPSAGSPVLDVVDGKLTVNSSTIDLSPDYGLYMASGTVSINNSTISNSTGYGIRSSDGTGGNLTLTGNKFINNELAVYLDFANGLHLIFNPPSNNTSSGNGENGYNVHGTFGASQTWSKDMPYDPQGIVIPATSTLTINPGTIVKSNGSYIDNNGTLNAQGASTSTIYFTSYKDDSIGGDTNNDGASSTPASGDWSQIVTGSGATTTINYAMVRYGGGRAWTWANFYEGGGSLTVKNSTIASSSNYGVYIDGGTVNISTSTIANNPSDGVFNNTTVTSTAQHDYWNASSGPSGVATGTGDGVTAYVTYIPISTSTVP